MDDEDTLQALNYANELEHQREVEQQMLRDDPGYTAFLLKVEREHAESL